MKQSWSSTFCYVLSLLWFLEGCVLSWGRVLQDGEAGTTSTSTNQPMRKVGFVWSEFSLLSGALEDCPNATAQACEGGLSAATAWLRQQEEEEEAPFPTFLLQSFEFTSVFVQMHPLGWNVNRYILKNRFDKDVYYARNSFLGSHKADLSITQNDLSGLQTFDIQPLAGNTVVDTRNSWNQYLKHVYFDQETRLATIVIDRWDAGTSSNSDDSTSELNRSRRLVEPIAHARRLMSYIAQANQAIGCSKDGLSDFDTYVALKQGLNPYNSTTTIVNGGANSCWIPAVVYTDENPDLFRSFVEEAIFFDHPPSLILNTVDVYEPFDVPRAFGPHKTWVVTLKSKSKILKQVVMEVEDLEPSSQTRETKISNISIVEEDLEIIPDTIRQDAKFQEDIAFLNELADEASLNNPVLGSSGEMPFARPQDNRDIRPCMGGECPIGSLFADALRWYTGADFAFLQAGGFRGPGWPAGPVRVSNIWEALPFANTECTGVVSGISLYRLFEFSTRTASFQTLETTNGDRLMQVSGLRYTYNTQLEAPRLVNLEIWDNEVGAYVPVDRLSFYKFATSSWMCGGFDPYPAMLSEDSLTIPGEEAGTVGGELFQNLVGDYLAQLESPYDTSIQKRLVNDTQVLVPLDFLQTEETCNSSTFWVEEYQTCFSCPTTNQVLFALDQNEFFGVSGASSEGRVLGQITNGEDFPIVIALKSMPSWTSSPTPLMTSNAAGEAPRITIAPKGFFSFELVASPEELSAGIATGPVSFAVLDGGDFPGCVSRDLVTEISFSVGREPTLSETGSIKIVGFCLLGVIWLIDAVLCVWVYQNREHSVIKAMQPGFLLAICFGVGVMAMMIGMLSLVNQDVSERTKNFACMAQPWFLSMGFSIVMSALFTKLWRLNKVVFMALNFRRKNVPARQAFFAFAIVFSINFVLLMIWTFTSPLEYTIASVPGEDWNLYGTCAVVDTAGWVCMGMTLAVNFVTLLLALHQAYRARDISSQFSESKGLALAIFSWVQLGLVGLPVLFLIDKDNVAPRYFLQVALIFAGCLSMMFFVFSPMILRLREQETGTKESAIYRVSSRQMKNPGVQPASGVSSFVSDYNGRTHDGTSRIEPSFASSASRVDFTGTPSRVDVPLAPLPEISSFQEGED